MHKHTLNIWITLYYKTKYQTNWCQGDFDQVSSPSVHTGVLICINISSITILI